MLEKIMSRLNTLRIVIVPLGRWCRTEKPLNDIKVDLANMDHCGTCAYEKKKNVTVLRDNASVRQSAATRTKMT